MAFSVTSPETGDPIPSVKEVLSSVSDKGIELFQKSNAEIWKSIWEPFTDGLWR